jgi:hypothetical protein
MRTIVSLMYAPDQLTGCPIKVKVKYRAATRRSRLGMTQHNPSAVGIRQVEAAYTAVFRAIDLNVAFDIIEIEVMTDAWGSARTNSSGTNTINGTGDQHILGLGQDPSPATLLVPVSASFHLQPVSVTRRQTDHQSSRRPYS